MILRRISRRPAPGLDIFDEAAARPGPPRVVVLTKPVPRPNWRQVDPSYCCEGCELLTELLGKLRELGIDVDVEELQRRSTP